MRRAALVLVAMPLLAACSFDLSAFHGEGGGSSASVGATAGAGKSSSNSIGSSTAATSTVASTSSSSTGSGTGGGPAELLPCGGVTDNFSTFDGNVWDTLGTVGEEGGHLRVQIAGNSIVGQAALKAHAQFDECYASIVVVDYKSSSSASLAVIDGALFDRIGYDRSQRRLAVAQKLPFDPGADPDALGIAFHAGRVYFFYHLSGGWKLAQDLPREWWMNNGANDTLAIVVGPGQNDEEAFFDDFNINPITLGDL